MTTLTLSRIVPQHTKSITFVWLHREFQPMGPAFRKARDGMKVLDSCGWCQHTFEDGEMMALGGPAKGRNMLLCQTCADQARPGDEGKS